MMASLKWEKAPLLVQSAVCWGAISRMLVWWIGKGQDTWFSTTCGDPGGLWLHLEALWAAIARAEDADGI